MVRLTELGGKLGRTSKLSPQLMAHFFLMRFVAFGAGEF